MSESGRRAVQMMSPANDRNAKEACTQASDQRETPILLIYEQADDRKASLRDSRCAVLGPNYIKNSLCGKKKANYLLPAEAFLGKTCEALPKTFYDGRAPMPCRHPALPENIADYRINVKTLRRVMGSTSPYRPLTFCAVPIPMTRIPAAA